MKRVPIEAKVALRKAPAIVVNRGDEVRIGGHWYGVADYANKPDTIVVMHLSDKGYIYMAFHVDRVEEWRKG